MKKLRILIANDHELMRRGARAVLHSRHGWRVVAEAANGREAVEKARKLKPDVAILDISMPDLDGVQVTRQIREAVPDTKVLVLTMHESDQMVERALDAGADAYILKSDVIKCLVKAVEGVSGGARFLTPKVSEIVLEAWPRARRIRRSLGCWGSLLGLPRRTDPRLCSSLASILLLTSSTMRSARA